MEGELDTTKFYVLGAASNPSFPVRNHYGGEMFLVRNFDPMIPRRHILEWRNNNGKALNKQWIRYGDKMLLNKNVRVTLVVKFDLQVPKSKGLLLGINKIRFRNKFQKCIPDVWCEIMIDESIEYEYIYFKFEDINHPQRILIARFDVKIL